MRLIDESALKKSIEKWLNPDPNADRMVDLENVTVSVMMEIEEQPTAYDVGKVVEQLKEKKENVGFVRATMEVSAYLRGINDAIEIVKGGGVDDD